jgi:hypothetical protein
MEVRDPAAEKSFLRRMIRNLSDYMLGNKILGSLVKKIYSARPTRIVKALIFPVVLLAKPLLKLAKIPLKLLAWAGRGLRDLLGQYATKDHWRNLSAIIIQEGVAATVGAFGNALVQSYRTRTTTLPSIETVHTNGTVAQNDVFAAKARQDALDNPDTSLINRWLPRTVPTPTQSAYPGTR